MLRAAAAGLNSAGLGSFCHAPVKHAKIKKHPVHIVRMGKHYFRGENWSNCWALWKVQEQIDLLK
jgi:hypothetical protein